MPWTGIDAPLALDASFSTTHLYDLLILNVLCLIAFMRGLPMRFLIRLLVFLFVTLPTGFAAHAQITGAASHGEEEDLRQTVRALALRVTALEEELHKQRAGAAMESASLKPAALALPRVE